jgi:ribonucleoside-triphosphate reductase
MRTLEEVEKDLERAREALASAEGSPAEVYSRIVGYYRSVRNWNRGKREEYGERRLYDLSRLENSGRAAAPVSLPAKNAETAGAASTAAGPVPAAAEESVRVQLFWRPACPACPSAKEAAGRLGIPVDLVNADTETGLAEARRRNVLATPTAIFLSPGGAEIGRALDSGSIAKFGAAGFGGVETGAFGGRAAG